MLYKKLAWVQTFEVYSTYLIILSDINQKPDYLWQCWPLFMNYDFQRYSIDG